MQAISFRTNYDKYESKIDSSSRKSNVFKIRILMIMKFWFEKLKNEDLFENLISSRASKKSEKDDFEENFG